MRTPREEELKVIGALSSSADNSKINGKNQSCSQFSNDDGVAGRRAFFVLENACSFWSLQRHSPQPPTSHPWSPPSSLLHASFAGLAPKPASPSLLSIARFGAPLWMGWPDIGGSLYFATTSQVSPEMVLKQQRERRRIVFEFRSANTLPWQVNRPGVPGDFREIEK